MDNPKKITVSAIVPVFNEERTIAEVIKALLASPLLDEVIVVNDGSTDSSPKIIRSFKPRIKFINLHRNRGKGFALAKGIRKAHGEIVTFWDADLIGLSEKHVESLLQPILARGADVVLGYRIFGNPAVSLFKDVTGQRAYYRKDLLPHIPKFIHSRFGVEVYLNGAFKNRKVVRIPWRDLETLQKYQKFNSQKAVKEYVKEGVEIAQTLTKRGLEEFKEDWRNLQKLSKSASLSEIRKRAQTIKNPQIRKILNDYLFKYLPPQK
uniref:Glycosyltransferase family 2 protein n=1 Tax=candidate division WWE3 bacterium TaxID=2053526 RepID=A0A831Z1E7_UNCKA